MGIENRDYYRDERSVGSWERQGGGEAWSAVTGVLLITIGCFIAQMLFGPGFTNRLELNSQAVQRGAVWQLLTYAFLHSTGNIWHIVLNMWVLHMSGRDFEARRGSREFIAFYLTAAVISGLTVFVWESTIGRGAPVLGASGATSALLMVLAFTYPRAEVRLFGVLPMRMLTFAVLIILLDSLPLLQELSGRPTGDRIAHSAHLGGIVFGILYQRNNWRILDWIPWSGATALRRTLRRQPQLKVHRPVEPATEEDFDQRVDALLEKVAQHGEASLTDAERHVLVEASRRARNRLSK
jgi:membrane associated rhomboid family serine protease